MTTKAVLFDFDFTLADSSEPVVACFSHAFIRAGLPVPDRRAIERTIGMHLMEAFALLSPGCDADLLFRLFREKADEIMAARTRIFPEVPEVAAALGALGMKLGIVSTKYRFRIEDVLARQGLSRTFALIVGFEDVKETKPHPESLLTACRLLGIAPSEALYVGDSLVDAEAARRAGIRFAAVLHGRTEAHEFEAYEPLAVMKDLTQLLGLVKEIKAS